MEKSSTQGKAWLKPQFVRIGRIGDVAGPNSGSTENAGGNPCGGVGCGTKKS